MSDASSSDGFHIGIDVGGTKVLAVATRPQHPKDELAAIEYRTTAGRSVLTVLETAVAEVRSGVDVAAGPLRAVGVGMAGMVTLDGYFRDGPNLPGVSEIDVGAWLTSRCARPVMVDNDGNCAAWAEHAFGAGMGQDNFVFIGLGTGISCGLVLGGRRMRGEHGYAGEPGHMTLWPDGPKCACGRSGCWEALASGSALAVAARRAARKGRLSRCVELAGGDSGAVRGEQVSAALSEGDPDALQLASSFARWVALGLANLASLLDPGVIALGGSVIDPRAPWMALIEAAYHDTVADRSQRRATRLVPASAGRRAGALGAALLAAESVADRIGLDV